MRRVFLRRGHGSLPWFCCTQGRHLKASPREAGSRDVEGTWPWAAGPSSGVSLVHAQGHAAHCSSQAQATPAVGRSGTFQGPSVPEPSTQTALLSPAEHHKDRLTTARRLHDQNSRQVTKGAAHYFLAKANCSQQLQLKINKKGIHLWENLKGRARSCFWATTGGHNEIATLHFC